MIRLVATVLVLAGFTTPAFAQYENSYVTGNVFGTALFFVLVVALYIALLALYFAPTIIAVLRQHPNKWLIVLLNVVLGITIVGWIILLILVHLAIYISADGKLVNNTDIGGRRAG